MNDTLSEAEIAARKEVAKKLLHLGWAGQQCQPFDHFDIEDKTPTPVIPRHLQPDCW